MVVSATLGLKLGKERLDLRLTLKGECLSEGQKWMG